MRYVAIADSDCGGMRIPATRHRSSKAAIIPTAHSSSQRIVERSEGIQTDSYFRREASYGGFERHVALPEGAQTDKVKATLKNGVVEVTMPIAKEAGAKKIPLERAPEKTGH
jgi:Hsp20/alpha crystallin family